MTAKGLTFFGAWHWNHLRDGQAMIETLRRAKPLLDLLITHHFPLSQVQEAWELQIAGQCGKILLEPGA